MQTPRICHLSSVHFAGDSRIYQKQARSLRAAGFAVTVIAREDLATVPDGDIEVIGLAPVKGRVRRFLQTMRVATLALRCRCLAYVIHDPELLPVAVLLKLITRRRVVFDVHEDVPEQIMMKEWIPVIWRPLLSTLYRICEKLALPFVDAVVLAEQDYEKNYRSRRFVTVLNYPVIPDPPPEYPPLPSDQHRPTLVYIGTITANRGLFTMLEIVRLLQSDIPDVLLKLVGPLAVSSEETAARSFVSHHQLESNVHFVGRVAPNEISAHIVGADIGLALLHGEGNYVASLPTKLFEYMLVGIPVIVSRFPLWESIVRNAGCGVSADPNDCPKLAAMAKELLLDDGTRETMGAHGRAAVLRHYRWQTQSTILVALYRDLLNR